MGEGVASGWPGRDRPLFSRPECPLSLAAQLDDAADLLKVLRSGGAHLDFRSRDGLTAVHCATRQRNAAALTVSAGRPGAGAAAGPAWPEAQTLNPRPQTLLDLGASPDYKDSRGLTPLYHSALGGGDALCCELLLHDHAQLGTTDENGWQEIHQVGSGGAQLCLRAAGRRRPGSEQHLCPQACRFGHVQHLEHLLFYGADMGAQNASGNTALHVCALYNQVRLLARAWAPCGALWPRRPACPLRASGPGARLARTRARGLWVRARVAVPQAPPAPRA